MATETAKSKTPADEKPKQEEAVSESAPVQAKATKVEDSGSAGNQEVVRFSVARLREDGAVITGHRADDVAGALAGLDADKELTPDEAKDLVEKHRNTEVKS